MLRDLIHHERTTNPKPVTHVAQIMAGIMFVEGA